MSRYAIREAIEARNVAALAQAFCACRHAQEQRTAVLETLADSTVTEAKRIRTWSEGWLNDPANSALRARGDLRWRAVSSVYTIVDTALRESGVTVREAWP